MKANRNDPCPCGSGKKYKKCCLTKDEEKRQETFAKSKELGRELNNGKYDNYSYTRLKELFDTYTGNEEYFEEDRSEFDKWFEEDLQKGQQLLKEYEDLQKR